MNEIIADVIHDTLPMIPFLFLTYLLMEYLEHKKSWKFRYHLQKARKLGPFIGAVLGIIPQCGFSVIASGLYMNSSISLGTLIAVFISTSDEAIPILISQPKQLHVLVYIIVIKFLIAIFVGYIVDIFVHDYRLKQSHTMHVIHKGCQEESHSKHSSIIYIAAFRTLQIFIFIFIINFLLSIFIYYIGDSTLRSVLAQGSYLQPILASLAGFIPNCAASVILAQLYMDNVLSFGALCSGLITSAGLGLLVLLRMYDNKRDIIRIFIILLITAIFSGILLQYLM